MTPAALLGYGGVLYYKMGPACLIGMSLFAVTICIDQYLNKSLSEHQHEENKVKEKRLTLTTETFESIKTIKFYGWDESFMNKILGFRENEIKASEKIAQIQGILSFLWRFLPNLMSTLSIIIYIGRGENLKLSDAMEMVAIFNWIQGSIAGTFRLQKQLADIKICFRRIDDYLTQEEVDIK